jgi:thiol-disulfide isomerase/thioredoxin
MRKSFIVVLAVIAGLAGLAIGIATGTSRHPSAASAPIPRAHKVAPPVVLNVKDKPTPRTSPSEDSPEDPQSNQMRVIRFAANPQQAPAFLVRAIDGNIVSTAEWHGKVVLLNFWATWCPPCRDEIPELVDLAERYKDHLVVVGVSLDDADEGEVAKFAKDFGINYPIVMASREILAEYGGVPALPTLFVVSPDGKVVQKHVGLYPTFLYETEIRSLLGMPVDASVETFQDTGQIFLKNASLATELPDVDFSGLTPEQKKVALRRLNSESCDCGCRLTLAQCRINDTSCPVSQKLAAKVVKEVAAGAPDQPPASATPAPGEPVPPPAAPPAPTTPAADSSSKVIQN